MARRIHWNRSKGKVPPGAKAITRVTRWGNPFPVEQVGSVAEAVRLHREWLRSDRVIEIPGLRYTRRFDPVYVRENIHLLDGYDLACACPSGSTCHGDNLLELLEQQTSHE